MKQKGTGGERPETTLHLPAPLQQRGLGNVATVGQKGLPSNKPRQSPLMQQKGRYRLIDYPSCFLSLQMLRNWSCAQRGVGDTSSELGPTRIPKSTSGVGYC